MTLNCVLSEMAVMMDDYADIDVDDLFEFSNDISDLSMASTDFIESEISQFDVCKQGFSFDILSEPEKYMSFNGNKNELISPGQPFLTPPDSAEEETFNEILDFLYNKTETKNEIINTETSLDTPVTIPKRKKRYTKRRFNRKTPRETELQIIEVKKQVSKWHL